MKKTLLPALLAIGSLALAESASAQNQVFAHWPLTANNQDVASERSPGITTGTPFLHRYVLSNGMVPTGATTAYPAYSALGQAFGVQADGGGWSSNATPPGPGSAPKRAYYENFAITATAASRADSVIFYCAVPSSAAGRVAVTYSLSNYVSDSASVSGGKGPGGILPAANNATFGVGTSGNPGASANNPAILPQIGAATPNPPATFRLALNGATGVAIAAGQTLNVRFGFGVGSSSAGRYILLRDVTIKSRQALAIRTAVNTNLGVYPNPTQNQVVVPHVALGHDARIAVYNAVGAQVASLLAKAGTSQTTVSLDALSAGLYLVEYTNGQERSSARVVKE